MRVLTAAGQLWCQVFSGTKFSQNGHSAASPVDESHQPGAVRDPVAASVPLRITVDAAKYLARLSPGLYEEVVNICRLDAARQNRLISMEMVQNVVAAIYSHGQSTQPRGEVNVDRQAG